MDFSPILHPFRCIWAWQLNGAVALRAAAPAWHLAPAWLAWRSSAVACAPGGAARRRATCNMPQLQALLGMLRAWHDAAEDPLRCNGGNRRFSDDRAERGGPRIACVADGRAWCVLLGHPWTVRSRCVATALVPLVKGRSREGICMQQGSWVVSLLDICNVDMAPGFSMQASNACSNRTWPRFRSARAG